MKQKQHAALKKPACQPASGESGFPIVGIGASAGGLKAFKEFFSAMPVDSGMAFVLVQHLAPAHKSILCEIISRYTDMQVFEVDDGMTVQMNCVYIIPPNRDMALLNGTLQLIEPHIPHGPRLPIDYFFRSLAQDQHERAIGIVLSGTANDATLGLSAIKGQGGLVMAQSPDTAEFDGMPRSAIATGLMDYLLRILPYRTTENIIEGAILSCVDINELKKANVKITDMQRVEDALRTSEERFKKLFVEAPLGVALVDSFNGRFYDVNPMFAKIAGRTPEEMVHIDWMSITHPDDVQKGLYNMALLNAGKISGFHMEKRYLHRDGTEVWINMAIAPVRVEDKEYPRHLCMIDDITERKRTEDALRKANDLLRLAVVVRDTHDAVTVQDLDDRIIAWNPGAVRMYGWSEAEALKMNVNDRIPHEQREGALDTLAKLSRAKILEPYRTQRLTKDGRAQEVSIISTALLNEAGEMYAIATTERIIAGDTP